MKTLYLGRLVLTQAVNMNMIGNKDFACFVNECFRRYKQHDWGELSKESLEMNDRAVEGGKNEYMYRVFAQYAFPDNVEWKVIGGWGSAEDKLWIITEADRSATTILFPGDY